MSMRDPYAVLGVRRNAGADEIKAAWRAMAKAIHPDQNREDPHATARFAEAGRAYEVLKDPRMRNRYDQARRDAELRRMEEMKRRADRSRAPEPPVDAETAEEAVSRIFGTEPARPTQTQTPAWAPTPAARQASATPPPAAERPLDAKGADARSAKATEAETPEAETPEGQAGEPGLSPASVPPGTGVFSRAAAPAAHLVSALFRRILPTPLTIETGEKPVIDKVPDLLCEATVTIDDILRRHRVTATLPDGQTLKVALPPGTGDGSAIRLKEHGYKQGTARGDVVVGIRVAPDARFRVDGHDLRCTLRLPLHDAVLGCTATVTTPTGKAVLEVPPWSGPDRDIRLAGHGLPDTTGGRGDLIVELSLMLGQTPDRKLTDLMRSQREGLVL